MGVAVVISSVRALETEIPPGGYERSGVEVISVASVCMHVYICISIYLFVRMSAVSYTHLTLPTKRIV